MAPTATTGDGHPATMPASSSPSPRAAPAGVNTPIAYGHLAAPLG